MVNGMTLSEAKVIGAEVIGADARFLGVSTDSRSVGRDELFVALQGEHFDGHDFVEQAASQGASAAMVARRLDTPLPQLLVDNTRMGLGRLAALWRARHHVAVAAVTGSNGKTTTKEMLAAILARRGKVLATRGNLNNDIGVPLTLLALRDEHRFAVIEMGANHPGEIGYLTGLTHPDVAVITNAGAAHLEGFGSIEGVGRAKGEIFSGLESDGVAVINADDAMAPLWRRLAAHARIRTFAMNAEADVRGDWRAADGGGHLTLETPAGRTEIHLPLAGRHNAMNALAAAAVAEVLGASLDDIRAGLESLAPVHGRLERISGTDGMQIIDDTYNANPNSLAAALDVLANERGARWLVLGDMGELGADAERMHAEAGAAARKSGVERLLALGELTRAAVQAFGAGAEHYADVNSLVAALRQDWPGQGTVLVKGSRSMHMERVIEALRADNNGSEAAMNGGN